MMEKRVFIQRFEVRWELECSSAAAGIRAILEGEIEAESIQPICNIRFSHKFCSLCGSFMITSKGPCQKCKGEFP